MGLNAEERRSPATSSGAAAETRLWANRDEKAGRARPNAG